MVAHCYTVYKLFRMLLSVERETVNEEARKGLRSIRYTTLMLWQGLLFCALTAHNTAICISFLQSNAYADVWLYGAITEENIDYALPPAFVWSLSASESLS